MSDGRSIREEMITKFLLTSSQPRHGMDQRAFMSLMCFNKMATEATELISLVTGSSAEFYIQPMLSNIGDIDIMMHAIDMLAIPAGSDPPTQLPAEFASRVAVYEIIDGDYPAYYEVMDREYPGYVFLTTFGILTECTDDGKYYAVQCERQLEPHAPPRGFSGYPMHGPASVGKWKIPAKQEERCVSISSADLVSCMRCLSWPPQAADWPKRKRSNGWPNSETVDHVLSDGCDVVAVSHQLLKQYEVMSCMQWRMSFSRAEIVLLNSWMPVQQIVYHVLRVYLKTKKLTESVDSPGAGKLCNYHIKTLMMWACEEKPTSWWTDSTNIVRICVELLHTLADRLTAAHMQHYFIAKGNLFDHPDHSHYNTIARTLKLTNRESFTKWFLKEYMKICDTVQHCHRPPEVSLLFDDASTTVELQNAFAAVLDYRLNGSVPKIEAWGSNTGVQFIIMSYTSTRSLKMRAFLCQMRHLAKMDPALPVCFRAAIFLNVAHETVKASLNDEKKKFYFDEMLDILVATCLHTFDDVRRCYNARRSSVLSLNMATMLMKVVANNPLSTVQLIEIELSKAYLYRALKLGSSDSGSTRLANVYLAVLYYTTGQYQRAVDHCTLETRPPDHSQRSSHVVPAELLPKTDDDVDSILGLAVFYQHVRTALLGKEQHEHQGNVLTAELFAHYLHLKCLAADCRLFRHTSSIDAVQRYRKYLCESPQMLTTDIILCRSATRAEYLPKDATVPDVICQAKTAKPDRLDTSELVELLQRSAVEHLTAFRQLEERICGSLHPVATTDYEALYAYKYAGYGRCLQLTTENVRTLMGFYMSSRLVDISSSSSSLNKHYRRKLVARKRHKCTVQT